MAKKHASEQRIENILASDDTPETKYRKLLTVSNDAHRTGYTSGFNRGMQMAQRLDEGGGVPADRKFSTTLILASPIVRIAIERWAASSEVGSSDKSSSSYLRVHFPIVAKALDELAEIEASADS